jgi:RAB protein geranylgeranyltransferase component A
LSRAEKTVLQLDPNDFYGSQYRTLSLPELNELLTKCNNKDSSIATETNENEIQLNYDNGYYSFDDMSTDRYNEFLKLRESRKCTVDLATKIVYSSGELVPLLIKSSVGRYMEFKCIDAVLLYTTSGWQAVPATKGEIFKSKLNLKEKFHLQKFIKLITEAGEEEKQTIASSQEPFVQFLSKHNLSESLQNFILYTIAMFDSTDTSITTQQGWKRLQHYIASVGRYGKTAFLYPMYGISELNQSFCRVGAVYSGTYVLRRGIKSVITEIDTTTNKIKIKGIKDSEVSQELTCDTLIVNNDYRLSDDVADLKNNDMLVRCVTVTDFPVIDETGAIIGVIPPNTISDKQTTAITILQLDYRSATSPKGKYIITFQMRSRAGEHGYGRDTLKAAVDQFIEQATTKRKQQIVETQQQVPVQTEQTSNTTTELSSEQQAEAVSEQPTQQQQQQQSQREPEVYYQLYYKQYLRKTTDNKLSQYDNVIMCSDVDVSVSLEETITEAQSIFTNLAGPDVEFIERLPNPEEDLSSHIVDEDSRLLGIDEQLRQITKQSEAAAYTAEHQEPSTEQ